MSILPQNLKHVQASPSHMITVTEYYNVGVTPPPVHADLYNIQTDIPYDTVLDKEGLVPLDRGEC